MTQDTTPTERALTADRLRNAVKMLYWPQPHANDYAAGFDDCRAAVLRLLDGDAERAARAPEGGEIERLTQALRVATHSPHDQLGEPNEGFPVCSVCGAIQTDAERAARAPETGWVPTDVALDEHNGGEWERAARAEPGLREALDRFVPHTYHVADIDPSCQRCQVDAALEAHGEPPHVCGCRHQGPCRESNCGHHEWQDAQRLSAQGEPQEGKR